MTSKLIDTAVVCPAGAGVTLPARARLNYGKPLPAELWNRDTWLGFFIVCLVFLLPGTAAGSPVQKTTCVLSGGPVTCTLSNPVQSGDLLVFEFWSQVAPTSIADTLGSQWKIAAGPLSDTYLMYAIAPASGAETVTETTNITWGSGALFEYSGFSGLDATTIQNFASGQTQIDCGPILPTQAGDLIVGWVHEDNGGAPITAGSGYAIEAAVPYEAFEDGIDQSTAAVSATYSEPSWGTSGECSVAAFKSAPSDPVTVTLSGSLLFDTGAPVIGSVSLFQIANGGTSKALLASLPIASDGSVSGSVTYNAAVTPLTIEADVSNASGTSIFGATMAGSSSDPVGSALQTMLLLLKSLNAQMVLSHTSYALVSIKMTPTLSFP